MQISLTLFRQTDVNDAFAERRVKMEKECVRVSDSEILAGDLDVLAERIAKPYHFDVPEYFVDQLTRDEPVFQRGSDKATIVWHLPVRGDAQIFGWHGAHRPLTPTYNVEIKDDVMAITTTAARDKIAKAKDGLDAVVGQLDQYFPEVKRLLLIFNPRFVSFAKDKLVERHKELIANQQANDALAALAVPVRKRTDEVAKTFVNPVRKAVPVPDVARAPADPVVELRAYDDILATITAMAHGIERSPETFEGMDEEDIRIVLLIGLNAVYEGKATGETFNGNGKTDILIRVADRNLFIAECLVWGGQKHFLDKLNDQLLNYAVWRDTKTALIVFNRSKSLSNVLQTIDKSLTEHDQCVRKISSSTEPFRYLYRKKDDPAQQFYLTCLAFNVPEKPSNTGSGQ